MRDVPSVTVHLSDVLVSVDRTVVVTGGRVGVTGDWDAVHKEASAWRKTPNGPDHSEGSTSARTVSVRDIDLTWVGALGHGSLLTVGRLTCPDVLRPSQLRADTVRMDSDKIGVAIEGLRIAWVGAEKPQLQQVDAIQMQAKIRVPEPPDRGGQEARSEQPQPTPSVRDRLSRVARSLNDWMTPDARLHVAAFEVRASRGDDSLTIGPGVLSVDQQDGQVRIELAPKGEPSGSGITFQARVPVGDGSVLVNVRGGPVTLASIGVHEGDLGLIRVEKAFLTADAHLDLHQDGQTVRFDGGAQITDAWLRHAKLADRPTGGMTIALRARGDANLNGTHFNLIQSEADVGALQLKLSGLFERGEGGAIRVDSRFEVPLVSCQAALDSLPEGLTTVVRGMSVSGTFSLSGRLRFDPERPQSFVLDYSVGDDCRFTSVPAVVDVSRFGQKFKRSVPGPNGSPVEIESGPGTAGWVPYAGISPYTEAAVMTTEDGRFRLHRGFDHEAIKNALRDNLIAGKFLRGASTVTMQLVKNLYLDRGKTLSRKLQELILTDYVEQALTKEQILELYLNIAEFGPMIYGIGPAAEHYFRCAPSELSPGQAMYLSSILPNPKQRHFAAGGRVSEPWMKYIYRLLRVAEKRHWISREDLDAALGEWVVQGAPSLVVTPRWESPGVAPGEELPQWVDDSDEP